MMFRRPRLRPYAAREQEARRFVHAHGFTLIELVVVMLVLTIILGMVGVRLTRDQTDILRDEAGRLVLVLQNAQQQAILEGQPYAFAFTDEGYRFLRIDTKGKLVPIEADELLAPRKLPPPLMLGPVKPRDATSRRPEVILFDPSGEFPAFAMVLTFGDISWYVQGSSDGSIQSSPVLAPAAA